MSLCHRIFSRRRDRRTPAVANDTSTTMPASPHQNERTARASNLFPPGYVSPVAAQLQRAQAAIDANAPQPGCHPEDRVAREERMAARDQRSSLSRRQRARNIVFPWNHRSPASTIDNRHATIVSTQRPGVGMDVSEAPHLHIQGEPQEPGAGHGTINTRVDVSATQPQLPRDGADVGNGQRFVSVTLAVFIQGISEAERRAILDRICAALIAMDARPEGF
jgi:hypothetical protein